ncbi:MAG: hypothetical protein ACRC5R_01420 [Mycoplasmatales bacterium]
MVNEIKTNFEDTIKVANEIQAANQEIKNNINDIRQCRYKLADDKSNNFLNYLLPLVDEQCVQIENILINGSFTLSDDLKKMNELLEEADNEIASQFK